jgi:hypothetical protein
MKMKKEGLSVNNRIALIAAFGVLILGVIIQLGITQWNKPDVRYEEGSYYHTGSLSITSLRLVNYGHSDAENITVTAYFPFQIKDLASGDPATKIEIISGGAGEQLVVFSVERIVPSQTVFIYFATGRIGNAGAIAKQGFISSITYNGDIGKTGLPIYLDPKVSLFVSLAISIGGLIFSVYAWRKMEEIKKDLSRISNDIELLEETSQLIDQEISNAKESGINLPEIVEEAQKKVKVAIYGTKSSKRSKEK